MRKDIGLEVTDHIILTITAQGELLEAAKEGADMISSRRAGGRGAVCAAVRECKADGR